MSEKPITQRIKDRLAAYTAMLRDIDNQLERLDRMEMTMASPSGPDLTGLPLAWNGRSRSDSSPETPLKIASLQSPGKSRCKFFPLPYRKVPLNSMVTAPLYT